MTKDGKVKIDKFEGHNFEFWRMKIKDSILKEIT